MVWFELAVLEPSRYFVGCLFVVVGNLRTFSLFCWLSFRCCWPSQKLFVSRFRRFLLFCQPFWKLLAVFVSRLGSFSLFSSAVLEASVCRSCCFVVSRFFSALASRSCCFLAFIGHSSRCFSRLFLSFFFSKNFFLAFRF